MDDLVRKDDLFGILEQLRSVSNLLTKVLDQSAELKIAANEQLNLRNELNDAKKQIQEVEKKIKEGQEAMLKTLKCAEHTKDLDDMYNQINDPEDGVLVKIKNMHTELSNRINAHDMYWTILKWVITAPTGLLILAAVIAQILKSVK